MCTQCGFTFYNNPITSNEALVVKKGKVLLVRRAKAPRKGFWDIPGGFVEGSETPQSSVAREFREELGGHFTPKFILGAYADSYYWQGRAIPTVTVAYVGSLSGRITAQREIQEAHWFPLDRIPPMAFKHQYQALRDLRAFLKKRETPWGLSKGLR